MINFKLKDSEINIIFELNCLSTNVYDLEGDKYFELISELAENVPVTNYFNKLGESSISVFIDDQESFSGTLFKVSKLVQKDANQHPISNKYIILMY